jgi:hypothetical protein
VLQGFQNRPGRQSSAAGMSAQPHQQQPQAQAQARAQQAQALLGRNAGPRLLWCGSQCSSSSGTVSSCIPWVHLVGGTMTIAAGSQPATAVPATPARVTQVQ